MKEIKELFCYLGFIILGFVSGILYMIHTMYEVSKIENENFKSRYGMYDYKDRD